MAISTGFCELQSADIWKATLQDRPMSRPLLLTLLCNCKTFLLDRALTVQCQSNSPIKFWATSRGVEARGCQATGKCQSTLPNRMYKSCMSKRTTHDMLITPLGTTQWVLCSRAIAEGMRRDAIPLVNLPPLFSIPWYQRECWGKELFGWICMSSLPDSLILHLFVIVRMHLPKHGSEAKTTKPFSSLAAHLPF